MSCRVGVDGAAAFMLRVFVPADADSFPVVLHGDGCWHYASDAVVADVLRRGYVFAQFNRVDVSADLVGLRTPQHGLRLFDGQPCGAIAAWAWAYHRAIDALATLDCVKSQEIAIVGHSRGGKAALLAGATDTRIALTSANNSGAAGAGCFRWQPAGSETLADVTQNFPHWFAAGFAAYAGREHDLPFDQHFLKALVAPRALLTTEALDDDWSNPEGTWHTHCAARHVYEFLGAPQALAISFRQGGHDHGLADWRVFLDFCGAVFAGRERPAALDVAPFTDLPGAPGKTG
jgi:dienelactone hydrolase